MTNCTPGSKDGDGSDRAEGSHGGRYFDDSAMAWLVGEAVRHLNAAGEEAELAYKRAIELLRSRKDSTEVVTQLAHRVPADDIGLRWGLVHVLGDVGQADAADFLLHTALARLPEHDARQGCEGPRDGAVLVATMAVEALQRVAAGNKDVAEAVLKLAAARPARPILIEAVKAAGALGLGEKLREILPKEDHWMLDIRRARVEELHAEPEREDGKERGFTPPRGRELITAPGICGCHSREG